MQNSRKSLTSSNAIDPAVSNLQRELRALKLEEKKYNKLARKMQQLQKKSQFVSSKQLNSEGLAQIQLQEIQKLKESIDTCIADTQRLQQEYQQLDKQIDQSNKQISSLSQMLQRIKSENSCKRSKILEQGQTYSSKKRHIQECMEKRDSFEKQIDQLKQQVHLLAEQEYKLRKDAQVLEYQREQEENVKKNLIQYIIKVQGERDAYEYNLKQLTNGLESQTLKYQNLKEQFTMLKMQQEEISEDLEQKKNKIRQLSENILRRNRRNQEMEKQISILDQDIRVLSQQYMKETQLLEQHQIRNNQLNQKFDVVTRDAVEVWTSLKELLQLAENHCEEEGYSGLVNIRRQALQAWNRVQELL